MKNCFLLFLLFTNALLAQVDTVNLKKVRFEVIFEPGLIYGNSSTVAPLPQGADAFLNSNKSYGSQVQYGTQIYFFNKIILEAYYTHDKFYLDGPKMHWDLKASNSNYFVQAEPKYGQSQAISFGDHDIHNFRIGLGINFKLTKSKYIQPYGSYAIGKMRLPDGKFAFKDYASNYFYINDYSFNSLKATGYVFGLRYKYFVDGNVDEPSPLYGDIGIKIEYTQMHFTGNGKIVKTDGITKWETEQSFSVSKSYNYFTVGVFCAVGYKGKKFNNNFFFSSRPFKKNKVMRKLFYEKPN